MPLKDFDVPREERCFEDYAPGRVYEFAETVHVSEEDIIRFSREFHPQFFHLDPEAARESAFKGLAASGIHSLALAFGLETRNYLPANATLGSPGLEDLRWLKPLRPGSVLRLRISILEGRDSASRPDRGMVLSLVELMDQDGDVIMSYKCWNMIGKRAGRSGRCSEATPPGKAGGL